MTTKSVISFDLVEDKDKVGLERFKAVRNASKISYDFVVCKEESKEDFIKWLKILSCMEFGISTDERDIFIKDSLNRTKIKIKVSGTEKDIKKWHDNVLTVLEFLNSDNTLTYLKFDKKE